MGVLKRAPGIVPAIDMPLGKAVVYIDKLQGLENEISGLKIGSEIVDEYGLLITDHILKDIKNKHQIILDLQKRATDVPEFVRRQVKIASKYSVYGYIGAPLGGGSNEEPKGTLETFIEECNNFGIVPTVVLEMTQPGATRFMKPGAGEELAELSVRLGVKYFVAPANKPERLKVYRNIIGDKGEIISPGAGPQKTGDVVKDAITAVELGADHLVIGRGIYQSENPIGTTKRIYEAISKAHARR